MRCLLILAHPRRDSLCGALFDAYAQGARQAVVDCRERGTFPAVLKGFLDRVLTPGFAFHHDDQGQLSKLLSGRTADLITTMDTPPLIYRVIYRAPGRQALVCATLGYCGIRSARIEPFEPVISAVAGQRQQWLDRARTIGSRLRAGALSSPQRCAPCSRLARGVTASVLSDDVDRAAMRKGIVLSILVAAGAVATLVAVTPMASPGTTVAIYALLALLALAYTVPPLKLSYRGLGEIDVAFTHSAGAIMAGYLAQGGHWADSTPWLLALPLGLAVLPSILLAGCPDRKADQAVGKHTLVVLLGPHAAVRLELMNLGPDFLLRIQRHQDELAVIRCVAHLAKCVVLDCQTLDVLYEAFHCHSLKGLDSTFPERPVAVFGSARAATERCVATMRVDAHRVRSISHIGRRIESDRSAGGTRIIMARACGVHPNARQRARRGLCASPRWPKRASGRTEADILARADVRQRTDGLVRGPDHSFRAGADFPEAAVNKYVAAYAGSSIVMVLLEMLWLGVIAMPLYQQGIGHLMAETPDIGVALLFYLLYPLGGVIFAVSPRANSSNWTMTLTMGGLFGFFAYATYDLTNLATLRHWPVGLSLIDMVWGTGLSAASAAGGKAASV